MNQDELDQKLIKACLESDTVIAEQAIADGANVNVKNEFEFPIINWAAYWGHNDVVKMLLKYPNINVNDTCNNGNTPLQLAVNKANAEIVDLLLQNINTNVNVLDNQGLSPIQLATWFGFTDIVALLLKHNNIDLDVVDKDGKTLLEYAHQRGHVEIAKLIKNHGT